MDVQVVRLGDQSAETPDILRLSMVWYETYEVGQAFVDLLYIQPPLVLSLQGTAITTRTEPCLSIVN